MPIPPVVVITGVSSGIGRTAAEQLARRGCRVFGSVRNPTKSQAIPGVELIHLDVRDETSIRQGIEHVIAEAGRIDALINNAGTTLIGATEETAIDEAQALFDTNVFGVLRITQVVLPQMRQQGSGRIVNVSSVLGFLPAPYMGLYSASKHAVGGGRNPGSRGAALRHSRRAGRAFVHQDQPRPQRATGRPAHPCLRQRAGNRLPGHPNECAEGAFTRCGRRDNRRGRPEHVENAPYP
nr:SDR family NAD(P)-dependent oxidoreductase [Pseudomonas putida]